MNTPETQPPASLGAAHGSADDIVLELRLPVPVKELAAITDALCEIHGENTLFMRQVGPMLQLYKSRTASPPNDPSSATAADRHGEAQRKGTNAD